jgi:prepilin-type N-terminal cleavage/methylation domain-containing protein
MAEERFRGYTGGMARKQAGFTLVELMIVVAIIGILSAIAIPKFAELIRKSQEGATKGNLGALRSAIKIYYGDMEGQYPSDDLSSLTVNAKYIEAIPLARAPGHHGESRGVCVSLANIPGGCRIGLGAPPGYDAQIGPLWVYWEQEAFQPQTGTPRHQGDLWIGCLHTDTRGTVWTSY